MQQQKRNARDAVSVVRAWWTWLNDVVALGNDALYPSWNVLPGAQAQPQEEVCDVDGDCDASMPAHTSIDELRRFIRSAFTLVESEALQQRPDRSLDGVVLLIADPDHYGAEVQAQIDRLVDHVFRADDLLFVEFPDGELDQNLGLCRGIPRRQDRHQGGCVGIDSDKLRARPLAIREKLDAAIVKRLGRLLELWKQPPLPDGLGSTALIDLRRRLDVEAQKKANKPMLERDAPYQALLQQELSLSADYTASLKDVRDKRSISMARRIASQVRKDAEASADPRHAYIASVGASHIDKMEAELKRKNIDHVLVLCHVDSDVKNEVCSARPQV
ncbi:hypothetical protein [Rhizobacter sp. OV335]|uniref:hypothetical protein n=1 Tax=Rhizobacter sp. OV335 TaxID=1500264 RepID=UPI00090FA3F5|nr:hypothetical protein [Rhizobacter sp. OV335]SHN35853.1 hypothetical protein SAMN02787076_05531 [Rhizobacter sp. OV335]